MLNWLKQFGSKIFGGLNDLKNWVINLFSTVFSYIDAWAKELWNGISDVWNYALSLYHQAIAYIVQLYNLARYIIDVEIQAVERWVTGLYNELRSASNNIINWVNGLVTRIFSWVWSQIDALYQRILRNVWDPLWSAVKNAIEWIQKYGAWVYYMVTHPEALAALIGGYVLREFFNLSRKYSTVVARWLIHSMISAGSEVAGILADAIAAIL